MRIAKFKNILLVLVIPFLFSACSVFSPVKTQQTDTYVLNTLPQPVVKKTSRRMNMMVMLPEANQVYETTQMAYSTQPYQIAYYAKHAWANTPSQMLQSLLVQTLQETRHFYSVGIPSSVGFYDYVLSTQLMHFEQRFNGRYSEVVVTLRAQITKSATNIVVAAKQFTVTEPAPENTPYGGVIAANQATAKILAEVARFCVKSLN